VVNQRPSITKGQHQTTINENSEYSIFSDNSHNNLTDLSLLDREQFLLDRITAGAFVEIIAFGILAIPWYGEGLVSVGLLTVDKL